MTVDNAIITRDNGLKTIIEIDTQNVDFRNADSIKASISSLIASGKRDLVMNLAKVVFMDSSGLSVLMYGKKVCDEVGGAFAVCSLQNYVNNLVQLTNLNKTIPVHPSEDAAVSGN